MSTKRKKSAAPPRDEKPRIRRAYMESRFGQLHVTTAFPVGGGFDEHATLLCLHRGPLSSRVFHGFMEEMGRDRSVYAPDLPGYGESDAPLTKPSIEDYASAVADFLDQMRFRQVDVLGHQAGAFVAAELALARPQVVRRLALVSVPALTPEERTQWSRLVTSPASGDGSHLVDDFRRSMERGDSADDFAMQIYNGANAWWLSNAAIHYEPAARFALITQPALVLRPKDRFFEATARAKAWLRNARSADLDGAGNDIFRSAPALVAAELRSFLDRGP